MNHLHQYTIQPSALPSLREVYAKTKNRLIRQRVQVLLMLHAGHTPANISFDLAIPQATVLEWWQAWDNEGLSCLT